ncbi:MAG: hypothetical protein OXH85_07380 [Truepera sp.]|nr:hypothetical protein [Truepera sp.]
MAIVEAAAATAAVTQALKLLRSLGNKIPPEVLEAVTEAYSHALTSQQEQLELIGKVQELEATIAKYDNWETEKDHYELYQIKPSGGFVYRLRKECVQDCVQDAEPDHYICPNCYGNRRKSILQMDYNPKANISRRFATFLLTCTCCEAEIPCPRDIFAQETPNP